MTPRDEWQLATRRLGRRVLIFDQVDSTNRLCASLAGDRANEGLVIVADRQTDGRGQHGRTWTCEPGVGVLMSVLLFPPPELRRPVIMAAWAANAVCETIFQATGLQARIKWPNDVLVYGRKVCGVLIEQARGTVVGIGLNVHQAADWFLTAGLTQAASLAVFSDEPLDRDVVARQLIGHLDVQYDRLLQGDLTTLEFLWKSRLGLMKQEVAVECHDAWYRGRLRDLSFRQVEIKLSGGENISLLPEQVKHIMAVE